MVTEALRALSAVPAVALHPVAGAVAAGRRAERSGRRRVADGLGRAALAVVDGALASPYADTAVQRVLESGLAERAVARALSGELVDVVARDMVRYEVVDRVTREVLASDALDRALDRAERAGVPQRVAERLLSDGIAEQVAARLLDGPELERIVGEALDSPGIERMTTLIVESRVVDEAVARVVDEVIRRLPRTEGMWTLIDEIAASPAVTEAITQQSAGFADQVAGEVRDRSRNADARLERAAWRLLRRRRPAPGTAPSTPPAT